MQFCCISFIEKYFGMLQQEINVPEKLAILLAVLKSKSL